MKKILYALAFWNSVDLRLRQIQTPKIRLRVAGIVIGRVSLLKLSYCDKIIFMNILKIVRTCLVSYCCSQDKKNTADLSSGSPFAVLDLKKELPLLINHWDSIRSSDENSTRDFRYGAYDIVAALTEYSLRQFFVLILLIAEAILIFVLINFSSLTEEFSHIGEY